MTRKTKQKSKLVSIVLTILVVFLVLWAGPSAAIVATLSVSDEQVEKGDLLSFMTNVQINANERAPVAQIQLVVNGATLDTNCSFYLNGTIIDGCLGVISIQDLSDDVPYTYGETLYNISGYSYGLGLGYGYGYGIGGPTPLYNLAYNITINTTSYPASFAPYTAQLIAVLANQTGGSDIVESSQITFNISYTAEANETIPREEVFVVSDPNDTIVFIPGSGLENITIPANISSSTEVTLDLSNTFDDENNSIVDDDFNFLRVGASYNYSVYIPAGTIITPSNRSWDGLFTLPTIKTASSYTPPNGTTNLAVEVGQSGLRLNFSDPVRLVLGGMAGKSAFWHDGTSRHLISTQCDSATAPTNVPAAGECYRSSGSNLVIWTYHFSVFAAYTPAEAEEEEEEDNSLSGGGASYWTTYYMSNENFEKGVSRLLKEQQRVRVLVDGKNHYVGVVELTQTTAKINVSSTAQQKELTIGDEAKFDVTDDEYYDIYVKLNSIDLAAGKANLTIKKIYEAMQQAAPAEKKDTQQPAVSLCGNSNCDKGESCSSCPGDCGACVAGEECVGDSCNAPQEESAGNELQQSKSTILVSLISALVIVIVIMIAFMSGRSGKKHRREAEHHEQMQHKKQ